LKRLFIQLISLQELVCIWPYGRCTALLKKEVITDELNKHSSEWWLLAQCCASGRQKKYAIQLLKVLLVSRKNKTNVIKNLNITTTVKVGKSWGFPKINGAVANCFRKPCWEKECLIENKISDREKLLFF
jgi:hypothetical protein